MKLTACLTGLDSLASNYEYNFVIINYNYRNQFYQKCQFISWLPKGPTNPNTKCLLKMLSKVRLPIYELELSKWSKFRSKGRQQYSKVFFVETGKNVMELFSKKESHSTIRLVVLLPKIKRLFYKTTYLFVEWECKLWLDGALLVALHNTFARWCQRIIGHRRTF